MDQSTKPAGLHACSFYFVLADAIRAADDILKLPHFQELKRAKPDWFVKLEVSMATACEGSMQEEFCAVSHRWETPDEPDSKGIQLREVKRFLLSHPCVKYLWYDHWCMPQGDRTAEEKAEFKEMLRHINLLYMGSTV